MAMGGPQPAVLAKGAGPGVHAAALEAQGDRFRRAGDMANAGRCYLMSVEAAGADPLLVTAAVALERGDLPAAEQRLRAVLRARPSSLAAIRLMAVLALRIGRRDDAVALLSRALDLAPGFVPAREMRARTLQHMGRLPEALADASTLRHAVPDNPSFAMLLAALFVRLGKQEDAASLYGETLARHPGSVTGWLSYGHVLKAIGRVPDAVAAYRTAIAGRPDFGEAWWSLANLKTVRFDPADVLAMEQALARATEDDRFHLHFALGKAYEDRDEPEPAFAHYREGNRLRSAQLGYRAETVTAHVDTMVAALGAGRLHPDPGAHGKEGPIFVVGLPRSGSTLVEQILSSHPDVEGTSELPTMMMIAQRLAERARDAGVGLDALLAGLSGEERRELGREYRAGAAPHRHEDKPLFIDKMPNNWQHVALIKLILPEARIIDVRRHPMAVGWSAYKQHFARGQEFSYDLRDLGKYYRDYIRLIAAFDDAAPGHIHRVVYERLVADTEGQVRAMLTALGLPFDTACLRFWQNRRVVRTPSSEQVRRPVFRDALTHWTKFAPWMASLRHEIGHLERDYDAR